MDNESRIALMRWIQNNCCGLLAIWRGRVYAWATRKLKSGTQVELIMATLEFLESERARVPLKYFEAWANKACRDRWLGVMERYKSISDNTLRVIPAEFLNFLTDDQEKTNE